MNPISSWLRRVSGVAARQEVVALRGQVDRSTRAMNKIAQAARSGAGSGRGSRASNKEDEANQDSQKDLSAVIQRSIYLDINNPDVRGFHRARTAQIVGAHVRFKFAPRPDEVGIDVAALKKITAKLDRLRHLHSRSGGFDSVGKNRTEGIQQLRAVLTMLIHGRCLIHRVWRPENTILPLSIELIPGARITTPITRQGDPLISFGVEYADEHRNRIVAYHVRRVAKTIGDSFIPDYTWDRLPAQDCSVMELPEAAGMDAPMPLAVACIRMLTNRGEMMENVTEGSRAQTGHYMVVQVEEGGNPIQRAADDATRAPTEDDASDAGFINEGGVYVKYLNHGETATNVSAALPDPDLKGFMDVTDERMARGLTCSKSRFTRRVNNSYAGGRLEDQQDDPVVAQLQEVVSSAWQPINGWFLDAAWLTGKAEIPTYSAQTRVFWEQCRVQFPGKLHLNPVDAMNARQKAIALRSSSLQQCCEEDGKDLEENLRQFAESIKLMREIEIEFDLPEGSLDPLLEGKTVSSIAGEEIASPTPEVEAEPGDEKAAKHAPKPRLKMA